jgi:PAS domain S-box-containing protein
LGARQPLSRRAFRISVALAGLGMVVAFFLFTLRCLNIYPEVEHPGLNIIDVPGQAPIGHMSPVTAFCFLLASLSFLASLSPSAIRVWRTVLALGTAGLLAGIGFVFLLAYLYGGTFVPPALNTVLALVTLGLALLALAGRLAWPAGGSPGDGYRTALTFTLILILLAAGIVTAGYRYYRNYERQFRAEAGRQLSAIAEVKVDELVQYRKERLWDAGTLFQNATFSGLVRRFLEHPEDAEAQQQIQDWAAQYLATEQYDLACLFDAQGVARISVPAESPMASFISRRVPEVLRSRQITFQDFYQNEQDRQIYLTLLVPIFDGLDADRPLGVLALRIDPEVYLYPFLLHWPTPSLPAETLLVRRDGNDALCLNKLKVSGNTALRLRFPLTNTNAVAVKAVLGQKGIVEGRDYFGAPTLAVLNAIPDSPWFMVTRMDTAKVYAPLGERVKLTLLIVSLLLISAGLGIGAIWWYQRVRFFRKQYQTAEALRESEERFGRVFQEGPAGMAMLDETFHFIQVNPAFTAMLGYSKQELQTMAFTDITHPDCVQTNVEQIGRLLRGELAVYRTEKRYIARSGKEMWGQVQVCVVRNAAGAFRYFLAIVDNMTERKQAEEKLRRSETKFRTLYDSTSDAVMLLDEKGFFDCNRATLALYGCATQEEFCSKHPAEVSPPVQPDGTDSRTLANQRIATALAKGTNHFEWVHKRVDTGETFLADVLLNTTELNGKQVLQAVVRDITARKRAEKVLRRLNRALQTVSECNQVLVHASDEATLLADICRLLVERGGYRMAWVGLAEQDAAKSVRPVAHAGNEAGYLDALNVTWADTERGHGPTGTAIRTQRPVVSRNILADPAFEPWRQAAIQHGYVALASLPLLGDHHGLGALTVYAAEPDIFDSSEMELLTELAGDVAYGIANLRTRAERERAVEEVRNSRALYYSLVENLPQSIFRKDRAGRFQFVNEQFCRGLGRSLVDIVGRTDADFFPPEQAQAYHRDDLRVMETGQVLDQEKKHVGPDGRESFVHIIKSALRDAQGQIIGVQGVFWDITGRKRAEEAMVISETRYRRLFEAARDGILILDAVTGKVVDANPFLTEILGFSHKEFLGKTVWELGFFKDIIANQAKFEELQKKEYIRYEDLPMQTSDGRRVNVEFVSNVYLVNQQKVIQCNIRDITERKRAEEAIAHERQLLRTLIDLLPETFYIKDLDGRFLVVNEVLARQWGRENPSQMLGLSDTDLFPAELAAKFRAEEQKVIAGEPVINRESICVYYDGRDHTVVTSKVPFRDSQGRICGLVGIGHDITESKLAAQRIADELNFNRTVLHASPVGIVVFKASGPCISANETIGQITGGSREAVLKQNFRQLESWKSSGMLAAAEAALAAQAERRLETEMATTFGKQAWVSCRFAPFHYNGELHLLLVISDITERKRQERELVEKSAELERFTYTVSHDLKSPLVTVKTFLGYLEQDLLNPDAERVKQDVGYMRGAADKMGHLLDELLNLARVGRRTNPSVRVTFQQVAREAVGLVAGRISTSRAEVSVAEAAVILEGDRPRLVEIWQNLVENACKFMGDQPKPRVEIGVEQRGAETVFFVRDNGAGIEPRYHEKVFSLFEKLNPKIEGTGMGLALVKRVVDLYKGRIWVESGGLGQGTNFLFTLPGAIIVEVETGQSS